MIKYRKIKQVDNKIICSIIRSTLEEFDGKKPGTAYYDTDTERMFEAFQGERKVYYVAEIENQVIGGCGIQHLANTNENIAELQKLYLMPKSRGYGVGKKLVEMCVDFAIENNFDKIYLETFPNMHSAINLYKKFNFVDIDFQLGGTGHSSCDVWMLKKLNTLPEDYIPKNKHDIQRIKALSEMGYPFYKPILFNLFEWIKDYNWPVAKEVAPLLVAAKSDAIPVIKTILKTNDEVWKYWVLEIIVDNLDIDTVNLLKDDLLKIAEKPTKDEQKEEVSIVAERILKKLIQ